MHIGAFLRSLGAPTRAPICSPILQSVCCTEFEVQNRICTDSDCLPQKPLYDEANFGIGSGTFKLKVCGLTWTPSLGTVRLVSWYFVVFQLQPSNCALQIGPLQVFFRVWSSDPLFKLAIWFRFLITHIQPATIASVDLQPSAKHLQLLASKRFDTMSPNEDALV